MPSMSGLEDLIRLCVALGARNVGTLGADTIRRVSSASGLGCFDAGHTVFWAHRLDALIDLIEGTRPYTQSLVS